MKKLFAVMLLGIIILGTTTANDLTREGLLGKVHTINEEEWQLINRFGAYVKESIISKSSSTYDDSGNYTEWAWYNAEGSLNSKTLYTYDDKGNNTEWASYNADGSLDSKGFSIYDDKGNKMEWDWYKADGSLISKTLYTYDDKGNQTEWASYLANGSLDSKGFSTYNDRANKVEEASYNADGSLNNKTLYTYDDKDNETERASYNADGSLGSKSRYTYEYDETGNWTKRTESIEVSKFGKIYFEPKSTTIHEITYYPLIEEKSTNAQNSLSIESLGAIEQGNSVGIEHTVTIHYAEKGSSSDTTLYGDRGMVGHNIYVPIYYSLPLPKVVPASVYSAIPDLVQPPNTVIYSAQARKKAFSMYYEFDGSSYRLKSEVSIDKREPLWEILEDAGYDFSNADFKRDGLAPVVIGFTVTSEKQVKGVEVLQSSGDTEIDKAVVYGFKHAMFWNKTGKTVSGRFTYRFNGVN